MNTENSMTVESMTVDDKLSQICGKLDSMSETATGVIVGENKLFPFPLLMYVGQMVLRSSGDNIAELLERGGFSL